MKEFRNAVLYAPTTTITDRGSLFTPFGCELERKNMLED